MAQGKRNVPKKEKGENKPKRGNRIVVTKKNTSGPVLQEKGY